MTSAVTDNAAKSRFELDVDGHIAFIEYQRTPDRLVLVHTEVPKELGGRGIGSKIAQGAFDWLRSKGLKAELRCDFLQGYAKKHPEYADLLVAR